MKNEKVTPKTVKKTEPEVTKTADELSFDIARPDLKYTEKEAEHVAEQAQEGKKIEE